MSFQRSFRFMVCNADDPDAPEPPPPTQHQRGRCADCGRGITWIIARATRDPAVRLICGRCGLQRLRSSWRDRPASA